MNVPGSQQQRLYRIARRDGASIEDACAVSGVLPMEAKLIDAEDLRDPPPPEAFVLLRTQAAGCAVTTPEEIFMPEETDDNPVAEMAAETLRGDVRDAMLSWFKATPKCWSEMGEAEQRDFADTADRAARNLVKQACQLIAAAERPCIVATLTEYREKDGIEAKLKLASKGEIVAALHEACGREVLVVTSGFEEFNEEAALAEIDADQPNFPNLGAEYDDALDRVIEDVNAGALGPNVSASRVRKAA